VDATKGEPQCVLTIVPPLDANWHYNTAERIKYENMPSFWEDHMRINPVATYAMVFANPNNLVLDFNGEGFMAFHRAGNGIRAWLYGAAWGRTAMRCHTARNVALKVALEALKVQRIEAIVRASNTLSRKACERAGMHFRGRMPGGLWYNGQREDGVWFDVDRAEFGLEEL
jgi:RimJ/RimL family protein N-acetyltransferase